MQKTNMNKKFLYIFLIMIIGMAVLSEMNFVSATPASDCPTYCSNPKTDDNPGGYDEPEGKTCICNPLDTDTFEELINNIINFIFIFALAFAPLMFIVAGFYFITAAGDPEKIKTAKTIIWYTLIGLVIVLLAKGIIKVIEQIFGG